MTFAEPLWFWAFALLPVLAVLFLRTESMRGRMVRKLVAARLQDRLAGSVSVAKRRFRFLLVLLAFTGIILALARPQYGYTWEQSQRRGRDVILAIDTSKSMLATDLAPSRLQRAKLAIQDLLGELEGDRAGLVAFAGSAFLQAPLTVDYSAVLTSLEEVDTEIIPRGGTNIAAAIKTAVDAFGQGESEHRALVLFTDGEELDDDAVKAAEELKGSIRIYTVGVGSADGSLVPVPGANGGVEFLKDPSGENVKSRLDEERLRKIAEVTGGFYVHLDSGLAEMQRIARDGLGQMKEKDIDAKLSRRPIDRYQWPLSAGLVLFAASMVVGERKRSAARTATPVRTAAVAGLVMALFAIPEAQAKNPGLEAYERQDYSVAAQEFTKQQKRLPNSEELYFNQGAAAYKQGNFQKALDDFARAVTSSDPQLRAAAEYNLGNTLYQRGAAKKEKEPKIKEWKNALQHYDQALNVQPKNADAKYNRDLVQRLLDELQKEPPKQDEQKQEKQDSQDKKSEDKKNEEQKQPKDGNKDDKKQNPDNQKGDQQKQNNQQKQDGSQQPDQKSQGDQPQDQQQQQPGSEKSQQQGKDDPKQGKQDNNQPQPGQDGQPNQKEQPGQKGDASKEPKKDGQPEGKEPQDPQNSPPQDAQNGGQPKPMPDQPDRKLAGDIKPQNKPQNGQPAEKGQQQPQPTAEEQEAAEAQAAEEGKMTEGQAMSLLEALKSEDTRVQLLKPGERRAGGRVLRDW